MRSAVWWGRQSCLQAAFQAAVAPNQPLTQFARLFYGFVSRRHGEAKLEKSVSKQGGRLKAGLQPGLAAPRKSQTPGVSEAHPVGWALARHDLPANKGDETQQPGFATHLGNPARIERTARQECRAGRLKPAPRRGPNIREEEGLILTPAAHPSLFDRLQEFVLCSC
jgi:hypothetical protein